jgi:hypothetical protein
MPFDPSNPGGGYPNNWFAPPAASALSATPPTFSTQLNPFNSAFANPPPAPFSPSWGSLPPDRLRAGAWLPPTFPDAFGRFLPPRPLPAPPPLPTGLFSDALKMLAERSRSAGGGLFGNLAQASGATPIFGGGAFDPPTNQQPAASGTPANTPSQPASSWPAPSSLTTVDPISDPGGNLLLAAFRNNLSYASAASPAQDQPRTNDAWDVVSDTSADGGDPNVILVGGDKEENPPEKTRPIDPLTGLPEPRLPDSRKPLPTLPTPLGEAPPTAPPRSSPAQARSWPPAKLFDKAGIETTPHLLKRLATRRNRGITEQNALEAYQNGRLYFDTEKKTYIRYSSRTGVAVVTDAPSNGKAISVFEGGVSPRWIPVPWRPGQ